MIHISLLNFFSVNFFLSLYYIFLTYLHKLSTRVVPHKIKSEDVVVFDLQGVVASVKAHEKFSLNLVV